MIHRLNKFSLSDLGRGQRRVRRPRVNDAIKIRKDWHVILDLLGRHVVMRRQVNSKPAGMPVDQVSLRFIAATLDAHAPALRAQRLYPIA